MAAAVGAGFSGTVGVSTGVLAHSALVEEHDAAQPDRYTFLDRDAPDNDQQADTKDVTEEDLRRLLPYLPQWTFWPDYERASNLNRVVAALWPQVTAAAMQMARDKLPGIVADALSKYKVPLVRAFVLEELDVGDEPIRINGLKAYETNQDEVILEATLVWPSDAEVKLSATLGAGPLQLYVPVKLSNMQLHTTARVTVKPLLDQLPCVGSAAISLLGDPYVNFDLRVGGGPDLMSVPGIKQLANMAMMALIRRLVVYPNQMWVDIAPHGGVPTPPTGLLVVKVIKCKGLSSDDIISKADAYCIVQIREGRGLKTKTVFNSNNPVFNQEFQLVVDDPEVQTLAFTVKDDDFGWGDSTLGVAEVPLKDSIFIQAPHTTIPLILDLYKPPPESPGGLMALPWDIIGLPGRVVKGGGRFVGDTLRMGGTSGVQNLSNTEPISKQAQRLIPEVPSDTESNYSEDASSNNGDSSSNEDDRESHDDHSYASSKESSGEPRSTPTKPAPTEPMEHQGRKAGKIFVEVRYLPFDVNTEPLEEVVEVMGIPVRRRRKTDLSGTDEHVKETDKGVLTVNVIRATNLGGWEQEPDPYVAIKLTDKLEGRVERQRTSTMFNEISPRWGQKFDFAMISAGSILQLTVYDKTTAWQTITSFNPNIKARFTDKVLGKLRLNVLDIARAGRVRDAWPLTDVQQGDIELELSWMSARFRSP